MFLEGQVDRQTDRRVHRRPTPKQYPSYFIGGKPVLSTGYLGSCSRTQRSASGEARSRNPLISGQALYHDCAPQLGSILCRYDSCPTQYAPDLRGSILCMQGTQYAPRESILCSSTAHPSSFLYAGTQEADQTRRMSRMSRVFTR